MSELPSPRTDTRWRALAPGLVIALIFAVTSVALFLATEAVLLVWIRDDLLPNVVMLIYPVEAIKRWQTGG